MDYEELLKRAREKLPESVLKTERFEVPKVLGHIQGNRTVISNFYQICDVIRRENEHVLKFLSKELATPAELTKSALIIGRKVSASRVNEKLSEYVKIFVLCKECKKPDTKLMKEGNILFIKCQACGAKNTIKTKI